MAESRLDEVLEDQVDGAESSADERETFEFQFSKKLPDVRDTADYVHKWVRIAYGFGGAADSHNIASLNAQPALKYEPAPANEYPHLAAFSQASGKGAQNKGVIVMGDLMLYRVRRKAWEAYEQWMLMESRRALNNEREQADAKYRRTGRKSPGVQVEYDEVGIDREMWR